MRFYLGTHIPSWLRRAGVPLFVSRRTLCRYKNKFPRAISDWCGDSGGFTECSMYGGWTQSPRDYAEEWKVYRAEIGRLQWIAPQDWMCEPVVLEKTGKTVEEHQRLTIENYLELKSIAPEMPFIPVLQGWNPDDYLRCVDMYHAAGINLAACDTVGLGTICRRQATKGVESLIFRLHSAGIPIHAFGMKFGGFSRCWDIIKSADSLAWSYTARRSSPLPECSHRNCANCIAFALKWREKLLASLKSDLFTKAA